ncbi:protein kinase domain-containing protein [Solwaraspora sp. WMMB335]|uniref:protein kinase domain-containing protein n=1 Tax=Solwaraspora sp. WMMB335 TaxID=3404118 RepID=UPI003B933D35
MGGVGNDRGQLLGDRYRLIERLGTGGMSVVWRGYDEVLDRQVAIKVLAPQFAPDHAFRNRIRIEAQAAARLCHPHITNVYDYGEAVAAGATLPYVVMELVDGESLAVRLRREHILPWRGAVVACAEVASALAAAHAAGVVHRDVTPANVMLTSTGAKVVDFGISALAGESDVGPDGNLLGTPAYLAPERLNGGQVSPATDVYAVGLLLYRSLTGRLPWQAATITQMLRAHLHTAPGPMPRVAGLPTEVVELTTRCLTKHPADRPSSAEVAKSLAEAVGVTAGLSPSLALPVQATTRTTSRPDPAGAGVTTSGLEITGLDLPVVPADIPVVPADIPVVSADSPVAPVEPGATRGRRLRTSWVQRRAEAAVIGIGLMLLSALIWAGAGPTPATDRAREALAAPSQFGLAAQSPAPCQVDYTVEDDTGRQFVAGATVTNTGPAELVDWSLNFTFPGSQRVGGLAGTRWEQQEADVSLRPAKGSAALAPGESAVLRFTGSYTGSNLLPLEFWIDDLACDATVASIAGRRTSAGPDAVETVEVAEVANPAD